MHICLWISPDTSYWALFECKVKCFVYIYPTLYCLDVQDGSSDWAVGTMTFNKSAMSLVTPIVLQTWGIIICLNFLHQPHLSVIFPSAKSLPAFNFTNTHTTVIIRRHGTRSHVVISINCFFNINCCLANFPAHKCLNRDNWSRNYLSHLHLSLIRTILGSITSFI